MKYNLKRIANRISRVVNRKSMLLLSFAIVDLRGAIPLFAQSPDYPVFVAQVPNPNDYSLFANSGWDGNWYVGYNNGGSKSFRRFLKEITPMPM